MVMEVIPGDRMGSGLHHLKVATLSLPFDTHRLPLAVVVCFILDAVLKTRGFRILRGGWDMVRCDMTGIQWFSIFRFRKRFFR